jgi:hypothetical protein
MNQLALPISPNLPGLLAMAEPRTQTYFRAFFATQIYNKHTRSA